MSRHQSEARREGEREKSPQAVGDNRRAGDTDGNAEGGNSKSKGATNPVDQPAPAGEKPDES